MEDFSAAIRQNERSNEGSDIHLYFNPIIGFYTAFGISAFIADHIIDGMKAFSDEYQMPVMIISPHEVLSLRSATNKIQHEPHHYYHFVTRSKVGTEGYTKWTNQLKRKA